MSRYEPLTKALLIAYVVSMIVPEIWRSTFHLGEVPIAAVIMAALGCVLLLQLLVSPASIESGMVVGAGALALMTVRGYLRGNIDTYTLKFFASDVYSFAAFVSGYALARIRSQSNYVRMISLVAAVAVVLTYVALFAGLLTPVFRDNSERFVTMSIFGATGILLILVPLASVTQSGWQTILMLIILAAASLLSATRTLLLVTILAAMLCMVVRKHRFDGRFLLRSAAVVTLLLMVFLSEESLFNTSVFHRLASTDLGEEARFVELSLFWPQVSDDLLAGQGMGSRFVSNIVIQGNSLASATHVGIVTFLMKGGVIAFLAFAVTPLLVALRMVFSSRHSQLRRGGAASVLIFIALACMSGGWDPLALFGYGLAISVMAGGSGRLAAERTIVRIRAARPPVGVPAPAVQLALRPL